MLSAFSSGLLTVHSGRPLQSASQGPDIPLSEPHIFMLLHAESPILKRNDGDNLRQDSESLCILCCQP